MAEETLKNQNSKLNAALGGDVEKVLASWAGQLASGNEFVTIEWDVKWEKNHLTMFGNVRGKTASNVIDMLVTAFVSPDYRPGTGQYYAGNMTGVGDGTMPGGLMWGFILQSHQFTPNDYGKTIKAVVAGWVDLQRFEFERLFVIPK